MPRRYKPESDRPPALPPEPSEPHFVVPERDRDARRREHRPSGVGRVLRVVGAVVGTTATVIVAVAGGVVLHVGLPPARRLAAAGINAALDSFEGKVDVQRIDRLALDGVDGVVATVTAPDGKRVLLLEGVRARVAVLRAAWSAIFGKGDIDVDVTELGVDHVEALLEQDEHGNLTLLDAFNPKKAGPPKPPDKSARGVALHMPRIDLKHAWVHGGMAAVPVIDAELAALDGAFGLDSNKTQLDLRRFRLSTRSMIANANPDADVEAHLVLPANGAGGTLASIAFVGAVGGVPTSIHAALDDKKVDAVIDVPNADPAKLQAMGAPIYRPASAHLEAHGTLPEIVPSGHLSVGDGQVALGGKIRLADDRDRDTHAQVSIEAKEVDARAFSPTAQASRLGAVVDAHATARASGAIDGEYDVHVLPGAFGAQAVPAVAAKGKFTKTTVSGAAHVAEPGAPVDLTFAMNVPAMTVDFDARTHGDLARVPQLKNLGQGLVKLHGRGRVALGTKEVNAHVEAQVDRLALGGVAVDHATVASLVAGPLSAPKIGASIAGHGLQAGGYYFTAFAITAQGTADAPLVTAELDAKDAPHVEARAQLRTANGFGAEDVDVKVSHADVTMNAKVASIRTGDGIDVRGLEIDGLGDPLRGDVRMRRGRLVAKAQAGGIDLARVARLLGDGTALQAGTVALDVDLDVRDGSTRGHANVDLKDATIRALEGQAKAHVAARFDDRDVDAHVDADLGSFGKIRLDTDGVKLAGGALRPASWRRATGHAKLDTNIDLRKAADALPPEGRPFDQLAGLLAFSATVDRPDAAQDPDVAVKATTRGFVLTTKPKEIDNGDGTVTIVGQPFHTDGVDFDLQASVEGATGDTKLAAKLVDGLGTLLTFDAHGRAPLAAIEAGEPLRPRLLDTNVRAHLETPMRALEKLPPSLGKLPVRGDVGFAIDFAGTARDPRLAVGVHARNVQSVDAAHPIPVSLDTVLTYDGDKAQLHAIATRPEGKVLDAQSLVRVKVADVLDAKSGAPVPWEASADAQISKLPLQAIATITAQDIRGDLSGRVALHDLHKAAKLDVQLQLDDLSLDGAKYPHATATLDATDGSMKASARIEQADRGYADVRANAAMKWGTAVAPALDETRPVDFTLTAKNFRLRAAEPFVQGALSELDGRLDADAKLHAEPGLKNGSMSGAIVVRDALLESPAIGEEFHDVHARIIMKPWGTLRVEDLRADGITGRLTASATAQLEGLQLKKAQAVVHIAQDQKVPLTMQGVSIGSAWGVVETKANVTSGGKRIDVDVDVPELHVDLPQSTAHGVQSLDADPDIKIGMREPDGKFAIVPLGPPKPPPAPSSEPPTHMHIATHLKDIVVKRDTTLKATITGGPVIDVNDQTVVSGQINLPQGFLEVQGKRFHIDKGTVNFTGQPTSNPVVVAEAHYDAPDGTRVYADFTGPVKTGKLTLRSEPKLSQNEILSLLLFGSADGTFGSSPPAGQSESDAAKAAGMAGGVVTQGINKAISGVSDVDITTRVDTTESQNPRPEVQVQVSKDVTAQVTYNLGVPPPGQNPDTTLLSVDWRFIRDWSAEATIGDRGTSILDLTWKYRY